MTPFPIRPHPGEDLHATVADAKGRPAATRPAVEALVASLTGWHFGREIDAMTGDEGLAIRCVPAR